MAVRRWPAEAASRNAQRRRPGVSGAQSLRASGRPALVEGGMPGAMTAVMRKPHTEPSYDADLDAVRALVGRMSRLVGWMLDGSLKCLVERDSAGAAQVAARDGEVDALEMEIDERCLKLLARWQPVASDLRLIGATLKLVTDVERVGDHCVNICERVKDLQAEPVDPPAGLAALIPAVPALLNDAFGAWRAEDVQVATQVIERGARIEALVRDLVRGCFDLARHDSGRVVAAIGWHDVAGYLHRIAAHATNIAEMVIFLVRGQDVRHSEWFPTGV
jgi:phosphate transport system protein